MRKAAFTFVMLSAISPLSNATGNLIDAIESNLYSPIEIVGDAPSTLQQRMAHYQVPGLVIAVINDHELAWVKGYGVKEAGKAAPVTEETLFQVASISKAVTSTAVLHLASQDKIDLDKEANDYLTSWKVPDSKHTTHHPVLVRHFINHTSGLSQHGFPGYPIDQPVPNAAQILTGEAPANTEAVHSILPPGISLKYSGGGYTALQQLLIDHFDIPFAALLEQTLLSPLKMENSTFELPLPESKSAQVATGHPQNGLPIEGRYHQFPELAAAGLWTTAPDLAKFIIEIQTALKGGESHLIDQKTAKTLTSPSIVPYHGMGYFLNDYQRDGNGYFEHSGWNYGYVSRFVAHTQSGQGVIVLTNANQPGILSEIVNSVAKAYEWQDFSIAQRTPKTITEDEITLAIGTYRHENGYEMSIFREGKRLFIQFPEQEKKELIKTADYTFIRRDLETPMIISHQDDGVGLAFVNPDGSRTEYTKR
ncbi:serine hydrolase domain-containing protein [Thaumasiovibrio subtropicus]|uniref:serine hydrolase domain-containing protein n=1 Tax=Thaumasiovibrio subtropicus TaxID=1891207 RepID=UPI000B354731|nr:serine hydrolase domain-containing protein [Thaumasiovibrio subtropicus]